MKHRFSSNIAQITEYGVLSMFPKRFSWYYHVLAFTHLEYVGQYVQYVTHYELRIRLLRVTHNELCTAVRNS